MSVETKIRDEIRVYPNPASEWCLISYDLKTKYQNIKVVITDELGKIVYTTSSSSSQTGNIVLDTKSWPAGIYLYQVIADDNLLKSDRIAVSHP
jgi:hypothetical protein